MLAGKSALVTGSTSGIGLAVAHALAAEGANVMLHGLGDPEAIRQLCDEFEAEYDVEVAFSGADLRFPAAIETLARDVTDRFGHIDILVNNAGIQHTAPIEEFPADRWDDIIAVNLSAAFHATRLLLPGMREAGWGRVINTASAHGLVASAEKVAYIAAKHGIVGMTKVVALETAQSPITCNAICPGWVRTELIERQIEARAEDLGVSIEEGARALLAEKQPSMEFVEPEQVAHIAVFLCSDAASQITGAAISVDGGWTAQ
ncbi:MAG: 3-hydroxybutyrate dehydrogenase [Chloroflexi bacterium]|nr:3-hydroxybutyrate dehydrogenase [Chloroflexota bacterium]